MTSLILVNKEELAEIFREQTELILSKFEQNKQTAKESSLDKLYTRDEAATYLKISLPTLSNWTKIGIIQSKRVQGRVYYLHYELQKVVYKNAKNKMIGD